MDLETSKARVTRFIATASPEELDEFQKHRSKLLEDMTHLHMSLATRWSLTLGIGNGAGLAAVSSKLLGSPDESWTYLLVPSAAAFALGACCVGVSQGLALWRHEHKVRVITDQNYALNHADFSHWREENRTLSSRLWFAETSTEVVAGLAFVIGVLFPVIVLGSRLFMTGTLAP
jgi:hypothetical protein